MHTFRSQEILGSLCYRSLHYLFPETVSFTESRARLATSKPQQAIPLSLSIHMSNTTWPRFLCRHMSSNLYSKCSYPPSHLCSSTSAICKQQPRMLTLKIHAMLNMDFACLTRSGIITRVSALILFNMEAQSHFAWSY